METQRTPTQVRGDDRHETYRHCTRTNCSVLSRLIASGAIDSGEASQHYFQYCSGNSGACPHGGKR